MAVKIITDSTSYIPKNLIDEYDIGVVSLSVVFEDEVFEEGSISNFDFFAKFSESTKIPTSSQPSVAEFYQVFEREVKEGNEIVGIFISAKMSGTYSTAELVKRMILEEYPAARIKLIDSMSNSMQLGFAVLAAAKAAASGKSLDEVVAAANSNISRSKFIFIPDTLEYLRIGGRIGTASALLGSLLQIKPILTVVDGSTTVLSKIRTKKVRWKQCYKYF